MTRRWSILLVLTWLMALPTVIVGWQAPGTATMSGQVIDETGQPVRLAIVTASGDALPYDRSTVTGDDGRFEIGGLPAGRFLLEASKAAFVTNRYGATRPGRPGTPVTVAAGQQLADLRVELPRGAVITGIVRDPNGDPAPNIEVSAVTEAMLAWSMQQPMSLFTLEHGALTDDRGRYRIFGLAPGEYVVGAGMRVVGSRGIARPSESDIDAALQAAERGRGSLAGREAREPASGPTTPNYDLAPAYHPSTTDSSSAVRIKVDVGEIRDGVDIDFVLQPTSTIRGLVTTGTGELPDRLRINFEGGSAQVIRATGAGPRVVCAGRVRAVQCPQRAAGPL